LKILDALDGWNVERQAQGKATTRTRIGINSGPVVVGDIGSNRRADYTVLGNTVNVASRLEGVAGPDGIVIGEETHRLIGDKFVTEPLEPIQLKGLRQKVSAYRVVRG
jgi:adenylate cyclase